MKTRILIPKGLQVIVIDDNSDNDLDKNVLELRNRRKCRDKSIQKIISAEEEHEEKPSSSSGHCETGSDPVDVNDNENDDDNKIKNFKRISSTSTSSSSSSSDSEDSSSSSSDSESDGESEQKSSGNSPIIGSSEALISKSKTKKNRKRKKTKKNGTRESKSSKDDGKLFQEKEKKNEEVQNKVKICATRLIEKGTVFTANDGDVQVVQLKGIPAIPRDDVRFMFGCFETIAPSTPLIPTSPPGVTSAATTTTSPETDEGFIRLCNWIRFLPSVNKASSSSPTASTERRRSSISNPSSESDMTDEKKCSHDDNDQDSNSSSDNQASWNSKKRSRSKNPDPDYISNLHDDAYRAKLADNDDGKIKSIKSRLRKRRRHRPDQRYSDSLGGNPSKSSNIIARFVDGRSLFEATTRLVPGTELVAYFDMDSFISRSSPTGISPFNAMMMMGPNNAASAMYMNLSASQHQQQNHSGIISSTSPPSAPSSTSTSTSISSSSSSSLVGGVGKGNNNNGKGSERDEKGQPFQHSLFPFYPYALHHHHYYHQQQQQFMNRGGFMMNNAGEPNLKLYFPNSGSLPGGNGGGKKDEVVDYAKSSRMGGGLKIKEEVETVDMNENEEGRGNKQGMEIGIDGPLDLTKLSKDSKSGLKLPPEPNSGLLRIKTEPLKIGTPFDSPDSNDDDKSLIGEVRGDYFGNELRNTSSSRAAHAKSISSSSHLFSIRNVLKRKSSPSPPPSSTKLFQPYCFDAAEKEKEVMRWKGVNMNQIQMQHPQGDRNLPQQNNSLFRSTPLSTPPSSHHNNRSSLSPGGGIQASPPAQVQVLRPILRTRGRERSLLPCEVCGKAFDRPSLLKRHLRTHTGEKPHVCDVCSKGFSTSSSLNTHRRIHSGEKPHQCPICGKRFTASSNLYYHRMTHNKEKPHKCMLCGKSFPTPGDLKSHQYVHSGSWPYTCPVCHRGFSKQTNLRNHLLLHSGMGSSSISNKPGDKPHTCHICDKKFALASNLRAHLKTHEVESDSASSTCLICKRTFLPSLNMLVNGRCQSCIYNAASTNSDGRMTIDSARSSDTASPQNNNIHLAQMEKVKSTFPSINMETAGLMTHNSKLLSPNHSIHHGLGQLPSHHHSQPNPLSSFALPQISTFPLAGLPGALSSLSGGSLAAPNFHFPPSSPVNQPSTPNSVSAAAAALFRNAAAGGSPATNPFIEHLLELNYRYAKETAGNLSLGIMQQKLLESQMFAAQLMSSQGFGMSSGSAALQDILKLRAAAARAEGFRQLDSVGSENMQR